MKKRLLTRYSKFAFAFICAITVIMMCFIFLSSLVSESKQFDDYYLQNNNNNEYVLYPQIIDDKHYLFIPSGFSLADFSLISSKRGKSIEYAAEDQTIKFEINNKQYNVHIHQIESVPSVFIDVKVGSIEAVDNDVDKNIKARAMFRLYDTTGSLLQSEMGSIKGRGNTSWRFYKKKPYTISFDEHISVFGMEAAKNWCLISGVTDRYAIANNLVYGFAKELDFAYSPDSCFANIYINGKYHGLYTIAEKIEVAQNRLSLDLSKSYLLESDVNMQIEKIKNYFVTKDNTIMEIKYPEVIGQTYKEKIFEQVQELEDALKYNENDRWKDLIDIDSWARVYLIDELFENEDGGYYSIYIYKNDVGKFVRGPIWDYDRVLSYDVDAIMAGNRIKFSNQINASYNYYLLQKEEFRNRVLQLLKEEFIPLVDKSIESYIKDLYSSISSSLRAEQLRWNRRIQEDFENTIIKLLKKRSSFLVDYYTNIDKYCKVQIEDDNSYLRDFVVLNGNKIIDIKDMDYSLLNQTLYHKDTKEVFDSNEIINNDICLVRKTNYSNFVPVINVDDSKRHIGAISTMFIGIFVSCFCIITYIMNKRNKND